MAVKKSQRELARETREQRLEELQNAARLMMLGRGMTVEEVADAEDVELAETAESAETADLQEQLQGKYPWVEDYIDLCEQYNWRVAAYIAWASSPSRYRTPATQIEFGELVDRSPRTIREWIEKDASINEAIKLRQAAPLFAHRRDIYNALMASASMSDPSSHADRKLALEMMGDYIPRSKKEITAGAGASTPFTSDEFAQATTALDAWEAQMMAQPSATKSQPAAPVTEAGGEDE